LRTRFEAPGRPRRLRGLGRPPICSAILRATQHRAGRRVKPRPGALAASEYRC
jgi:hypothetical protein